MTYIRHQRLLLALTSQLLNDAEHTDTANFGVVVISVVGVLCLIIVVLMCACQDGQQSERDNDLENQSIPMKQMEKSLVIDVETSAITTNNGTNADSNTRELPEALTEQSLKDSSCPVNVRPASSRELPALPPASTHRSKKLLSGPRTLDTVVETNTHDDNKTNSTTTVTMPAPQQTNDQINGRATSHSADYAHLGTESSSTPADYNIVDIAALSHEKTTRYSKYERAADDDYSQAKEEDPYNQIGESDGTVSLALIKKLKQSQDLEDPYKLKQSCELEDPYKLKPSRDLDDPYSTIQGDSAGDIRSILKERKIREAESSRKLIPAASEQAENMPSTSQKEMVDDYAVIHKTKGVADYAVVHKTKGVADYAVVHKTKGVADYAVVHKTKRVTESLETNDKSLSNGSGMSPYDTASPEPPKVYFEYSESVDTESPGRKKGNKYSIVTARESLASMSARDGTNPYDMILDVPGNTYAMIEGMQDGATAGDAGQFRNNQISSSDAEIGYNDAGLDSLRNSSIAQLKSKISDSEANKNNNSHFQQRDTTDNRRVENGVISSINDTTSESVIKSKSTDSALNSNTESRKRTIENRNSDPDYEIVGD